MSTFNLPHQWLLLTLLMAIVSRLTAQEPAPPRRIVTVEGITEYQLDNGLRLLLFPDPSRSRVTVNMTVLVGSRHEGYGETGMAHLLEHLVFKGTPTHTNIPKLLQDHGAQFNGSTTPDRTNYYETMTATDENLEFAIHLEADRLVNSYIKQEDLQSEFTVVRNEFESGENSPTSVLSKRIHAAAFEWHNYGKSTIGNRSDIERVPIENLQAFYRKHYQPDNVVLVVAGQFQESRALELVNKYFGRIPRPQRKLQDTYTEEPAQDGERSVVLRRVGNVGAVGVAYHIPAGPHEDSAALQTLTNILTTQPSGRLYKALIESKKASSVFASARGLHDPGLIMIQASVREVDRLDEVRETICREVERIAESGVSKEEVARARQQILKARELSAADTSQIAVSLSEWAGQGDWRLYFLYRDRAEKVTAADVQKVAARYLLTNNRTVGLFIPTEKAERVTIPAAPALNTLVDNYQGREAIAAGELFEATPDQIEAAVQRTQIAGLKVALLPKKSRGEEVRLSLTLRYGNEENLRGYETAYRFLGPLMMRGTKKLTYQQMRDELDRLKVNVSVGGGGGVRGRGGDTGGSLGALSASIQAKRGSIVDAIDILHQILREPILPQDQFEIMKREQLSAIERARTDPSALASNLLSRQQSPYPVGDVRYVPTIDESIERLEKLTYDKVVQLYREFLGSQSGELAIVGDFDPEPCMAALDKALAGWTASQSYARIPIVMPTGIKAGEHRIDTPDKANAIYLSGVVFPLRDTDDDYPALVIANFIYGGGSLSSRLGNRVRQKEGLSYGVGAGFSASSFEPRAEVTTNAICNPQNISKVKSVIKEELDRLLRDGVSQQELDDAKRGYLQSRKVSRASDSALARILVGHSYTNRTMAWDTELEKKISALTKDQVAHAVRKYVDPGKLVIVTAGDFNAATSSETK